MTSPASGASSAPALPDFQRYGENAWAAVKGYLDAVTDAAARR